MRKTSSAIEPKSTTGGPAHRFGVKGIVMPVGVMATTLACLAVAIPAQAATDGEQEPCVPSQATNPVFGAWKWARFTGWQESADTTPADPDGQDGQENLANVTQVGEGYRDTLDAAYRRKINDGWKRYTGWQSSQTPPAAGEGEEIGHRYEEPFGKPGWTETVIVVDKDAWTETIPAETHVVHHPAETNVIHHPAETKVVHHPAETHVVHHEGSPAETHTEWRFRTRVHRPGNTVERKFVQGYDFVDGGTVKVNGVTVSGHWVQSAGWHQIPDSIINAVWGSGGVPPQYLGGSESNPKGNVGLSVYGGPSVSVPYYASEVTISGGYTEWGPWSGWTRDNAGGDTDTRDTESKVVTDKEAVAPWNETVVDKKAWDETVVVKEAWDETVVVKEAWDETVIDTPERTVKHPAVTHEETVEHPGNQHTEYRWDVYAFHYEYRWSVYERSNTPGEDAVTCPDVESPVEEPTDPPVDEPTEPPATPATPATPTTPAAPTTSTTPTTPATTATPSKPVIKGVASKPNKPIKAGKPVVKAAEATRNTPTHPRKPAANRAAVPLSIDAGL